ncbi:ATP-binding Cassette (ABC) Superfamily [Phytophthora infestans T30-4]|uniref:ATP-binding Cassette (ABC) Superfamily n=1 Tax=Phytophthora infestans (strain T30-4) TaxID=403677 RepID=D0P2J2_PHYIT|nr:ATP-binding Cassette (ABC) Superfamily [Phytophthora infestans T30-4]EEY56288.1 ATP-binding Cassette (ABC) Superfamily [Phytophthora infestans T30-4]|eukprot:XP_002895486.1 ATP-binding Cassette (ABC) Superfamily [Phytophthora infestans T30-4]
MHTSTENLAQQQTFWTFSRSLLWKNWLIKKRQPAATACEILVPTFFIVLLGIFKLITKTVDVPAGWSDDADNTASTRYNLFQPTGPSFEWVDVDLPKFAMYESTMTGLMLKLSLSRMACGVLAGGLVDTNTSSPFSVPTECAGKVVPYKIGVAPDNAFTRNYFAEAMNLWYPRLDLMNSTTETLTNPSFKESIQFFDTNDALTDYMKSNTYGDKVGSPKIYAAIVFDSAPSGDDIGTFGSIEYSLRLNATRGDGRDSVGRVPTTDGGLTLVTRFVTCMPEWNSANQSTTCICQRSQTTAVASTELDDTLLDVLSNDGLIKEALNGLGLSDSAALSTALASLSSSTREALLTPLRQAPQPIMGATVAPFPVDDYTSSPFYANVASVFSIVFIMVYLFTISRILVVLIQEKELRLREFMKILGVTEKTITLTWYMTYAAILFVGAVVQALAGLAGLFPNSSLIVTFLFFFLFGLSVLALAFFISTLFSKARAGAFVGLVAFFAMYAVSQGFSTGTAESAKTIGSTALMMFVFDTILYTILGLYFEKVMPKEYGTSLKCKSK